jgi:hypothetical protein
VTTGRRRRSVDVKRVALAFLCAALAVAGCGTLRHDHVMISRPASNRAVAVADAHHLLRLLVLPPGAVREAGAPSSALRSPGDTAATPNIVDLHAWWRVKGTMSSVLAFVERHAPRGTGRSGIGRIAQGSRVLSRELDFSWRPLPGVRYRSLTVEVAPLPHGYAGVRADAEDIWIQPRPASERMPVQVEVLTVTRGRSLSLTTTNAAKLAEIAALIDRLPIVQPGVYNCPMIPAAPTVTFTFRARSGGPALAQASTLATGPFACPGMQFTINGRKQRSLMAGPAFIRAAGRTLGVRLLTK